MNREDIIKLARMVRDGGHWNQLDLINFATLVAAVEREKLAAWMMRQGYATGHGDTIKDLLKELEWQIEERIKNEREACAKVAGEPYEFTSEESHRIATAIRARGQQ